MMGFSYTDSKWQRIAQPVLLSCLIVLFYQSNFISPVVAKTKVHIVYIGETQQNDPDLITKSHHEILASVLKSKDAAVESMVYSYRHGFSGFAAKLTDSQLEEIAGLTEVVHVMPNHFYNLKTTRSWDYLGLDTRSPVNNLLLKTNKGDGVIVGVFDTGIWPESEQLNDAGLGPIPRRWRGQCVSGESFDAKKHCNRKLIGAKWFANGLIAEYGNVLNKSESNPEFLSSRDAIGHGTHTSTTAAGSAVANASFKGLARGIVRGGAPQARIAMYKVCWNVPSPAQGCTAADLLKAFDEAIYDGVDLLSLSLGSSVPVFSDVDPREVISLGSFRAVARGIPVVLAAGNAGPHAQTVVNTSPWVLTVAATTMDRMFPTKITLGNNITILGQSLYTGKHLDFTSLLHVETPTGPVPDSYCENLSFQNISATGKVVLCFSRDNGASAAALAEHWVHLAGGVGVIVAKNPTNLFHSGREDFPSVTVDYEIGTRILYYFRSTRSPMVKIAPAKTLVGKPVATRVAHFSSRGPSSIAPAILKPDIAAPGVSILASSSALDLSATGGFVMQSGTSMATPHVAGIVALLKNLHPTWSPAAFKSAIITTGSKTDPFGEPIFAEGTPKKLADPFDYGGGLVNPEKAADPGLVYDMDTDDYIHYLCSLDYSDSSISLFLGQARTCPKPRLSILDVNVPSITIPNLRKSVTLTRKVTNVGPVNSTYKALIEPPLGIKVTVKPNKLVFNAQSKTLTFKVTVSTAHKVNSGYYFGSLTWTDGVHNVASPISVRTQILNFYADDY